MENSLTKAVVALAAVVDKYADHLTKLSADPNLQKCCSESVPNRLHQSIKAATKMVSLQACTFSSLSKEILSLTKKDDDIEALATSFKLLLLDLVQQNCKSMNMFHDSIMDISRQYQNIQKPEDSAKTYQFASKSALSNRTAASAACSLLRDLAQLENKFSTWIWKSSSILAEDDFKPNYVLYKSAMQLSEGHASLGACLSADSHELMTTNHDITQSESQVLSVLKTSSEPGTQQSIGIDNFQSLQLRRIQALESAFIRLAQSRLALYASLESSLRNEQEPDAHEDSVPEENADVLQENVAVANPAEDNALETPKTSSIRESNVKPRPVLPHLQPFEEAEQHPASQLGIAFNTEESIISTYSCAILRKGFPVHGRLTLTRSCLTFHSPLLSGDVSIPFTSLLAIRKEKLGIMLPYGLKLTEADSTTTFTSFMYLDQAIAAIEELWRIQKAIAVAVMSPSSSYKEKERSNSFSFEEPAESTVVSEPELKLDQNCSTNKEHEEGISILSLLPGEFVKMQLISDNPEKFVDILCLNSLDLSYEKLLEHVASPTFWLRFLERDGHIDVDVSSWKQENPQASTLHRIVHSRRPLGNMYLAFGVDTATLKSVQRISRISETMCVWTVETECTGIPYSDCFKVFIQLEISSLDKEASSLKVGCEARFTKRTLLKGTIQKNVIRESETSYKLFYIMLKEKFPDMDSSTAIVSGSQIHPIFPATPKKRMKYQSHRHLNALPTLIIAILVIILGWSLIASPSSRQERASEIGVQDIIKEIREMKEALHVITQTLQARTK